MAVAVIFDIPGGTLEQYDEVMRRMGYQPGGPGAPHGLFHWVTATDEGIRVTDVWDSREAFERFAQETLGPVTQAAGVPDPQVAFHEVHNYLTAG